jgi:hypothetical protein
MSEKAREISKKMQEEAKKNHQAILHLKETARTSSLEIGWIGHDMKEKNQFSLLGFNTEGEYFKAMKIGRSSWFRYTGLAKAFIKLPKAEYLKLIPENADHLARVADEKVRYRKDLIKACQTATEEEFEKLLVKHRAHKDKVDEDDVIVTWKLRMTEGQSKVRKRVFKKFAEQHDIPVDDEAKILELICAELEHRQPVVTAMMRATGRLGEAEKLLNGGSGEMAADEVIKQSHAIVSNTIRDMCAAGGVKVPEQRVH